MGCGCKKKTIINPQAPQVPPPPPPVPPTEQPARQAMRIKLTELANHIPPLTAQTPPKGDVDKILDKLNSIKH